jgi:MazG family protein
MSTGERFERAVQIMHRLRAPGGCPWDREQTFDTIKQYTLEETYEVFEAIENRDWNELTGELGDLLLQVLFYSEMAEEAGHFSINDVLDRLSKKLVDRHPHVFGDVKADTAGEVVRNWEAIKKQEKQAAAGQAAAGQAAAGQAAAAPDAASSEEMNRHEPLLAGISRAMPALLEATKISRRAAAIGFDWPNFAELLAKLHEEARELEANLAALPQPPQPARGVAGSHGQAPPPVLQARIEDEVGDLFFVLVNMARYLNVDPEAALRGTNRKFRARFAEMEKTAHAAGKKLETMPIADLEALWQRAKQTTKEHAE